MAAILDAKTRVVVQGITGHQGVYHTKAMKEFGTKVVAGTTPGKGGTTVEGVPVFNTVAEAVAKTPEADRPNASIIFVPAPYAADAAFEALDAGLKLVVIITEHIPIHDAMRLMAYADYRGAVVVGPNCPGVISPVHRVKMGIMPSSIFKPGNVGVVSRSGTLTYEIVNAITESGLGQSTCIGLGGDPVVGTSFIEALRLFESDPDTGRVVMVGEIGGAAEEEAARYIRTMKKPVVAYIAGITAPPGKRMGHAGAIITRGAGTAESKINALTGAGAKVARRPAEVAELLSGIR